MSGLLALRADSPWLNGMQQINSGFCQTDTSSARELRVVTPRTSTVVI